MNLMKYTKTIKKQKLEPYKRHNKTTWHKMKTKES